METTACMTTDMNLFNRWLSDLAGTAIETHLRQRLAREEPPQEDIVPGAHGQDDPDQE